MRALVRVRVAGAAWLACAQIFVVEAVAGARWAGSEPVMERYLSDLGNTACGPRICSPAHTLMNLSFAALGLLLIAGLLAGAPGRGGRAGRTMVALGGLGWIMVGLGPENKNMPLHLAGAVLVFLCGNLGMIVYGLSLRAQDPRRAAWSLLTGAVGAAATGLFLGGQFFGLGLGGMERLAVYPIAVWAAALGAADLMPRGNAHPPPSTRSEGR
ncbi:DUF998 domain-containing protein [Nonomuraea rhizosphaerae]|uniref:DUF998 domain-containing protein n=1 Tax=Nonomuraea rhizosphaerae TaxID=2665663 RepID=UPI001C5F97F9|nr:DUF998 domain-containing protein [Nonomuraea rhizosphaerae]